MKLIIYSIFSFLLLFFLKAFTFQTLYNWFVSPIFNLNELNLIQSLGLILFIILFTLRIKKTEKLKVDFKYISKTNIELILLHFILLFLGWLVTLIL